MKTQSRMKIVTGNIYLGLYIVDSLGEESVYIQPEDVRPLIKQAPAVRSTPEAGQEKTQQKGLANQNQDHGNHANGGRHQVTPCPLHQISPNLCGCAAPTLPPEQKPDTHRDFTELAVGTRVRFAGKLREVELCGQCRLPAVKIESKHLRVTRRAWIHDAVVGPAGYIAGGLCTEYIYPPQKKKKR